MSPTLYSTSLSIQSLSITSKSQLFFIKTDELKIKIDCKTMQEEDQTWKKKKVQNRRQCSTNSFTRRPGTKYFSFPALPKYNFFFLFPSSFGPGSVTQPSDPPTTHPPPSYCDPPAPTSPRKFSSSFTTGPRSL